MNSHVDLDTLLGWIQDQVKDYESLSVTNITTSFKDGRVLCAIIHHYRPDLLDYGAINPNEPAKNNQIAFDILEKELGIPPVMTGAEMAQAETPDYLTQLSYLTQIYDTFRCEIPHIKHPKLNQAFSLPRSSTCMVPRHKFPLRPILITPQSSAKVSDGNSTCRSSNRISNATSAPNVSLTQLTEKSKDVVKDSKSIMFPVQRLKENDVEIKEIYKINSMNNCDDSTKENSKVNLDMVKSDSQVPSGLEDRLMLRRSKSSNLNEAVDRHDGTRSLKSLMLLRRKRCVRCMQKMIARNAQNNASKFKQNVDNSGDTVIKPLKPTIKSSSKCTLKKKSVRLCSTPVSSLKKISPRKSYRLSLSKDTITNCTADKSKTTCSVTPIPTDPIQDAEKTTQSSMAGSSEVALNFLKEMDEFLAEQDSAYEKLNNLKVQILRPKYERLTVPKDIPKFLLESGDRQDDVIIIKNIERGREGPISVEEVKVFAMENSVKVVPRLISQDYHRVCKSDNQVSLVETSGKPRKCQPHHSQYFDRRKLQYKRKMNYSKGDKSDTSSACKVEDWLVASNFGTKHRDHDYSTDNETDSRGQRNFKPTRKDNVQTIYRSKFMPNIRKRNKKSDDESNSKEVEIKNSDVVKKQNVQMKRQYVEINMRNVEMKKKNVEVKKKDLELKKKDVELKKADVELKKNDVELEKNDELKKKEVEIERNDVEIKKKNVEIKKLDVEIEEQDVEIKNKDVEIKKDDVEIKTNDIDIIDNTSNNAEISILVAKTPSSESNDESVSKFVEVLKTKESSPATKLPNVSPWEMYEGRARDKAEIEKFQTIVETEENDLPDTKRQEMDIKLRVTPDVFLVDPEQVNRPPSRHKRSTDTFASKTFQTQSDRKPRKRKTMEKIGASVICTAFVLVVWETGLLAFVLFLLDVLCNLDKYEVASFIYT